MVIKFTPKTVSTLAQRLAAIPKGTSGKVTLGNADKIMRQLNKETNGVTGELAKELRLTPNSTLNLAFKSGTKSDYVIGGYTLREGNKTLGQGYLSVTSPGTNNSVVKFHHSEKAADSLVTGYFDAGAKASKDIKMGVQRTGDVIQANAKYGNTAGINCQFSEGKALSLANKLGKEQQVETYLDTMNKTTGKIDMFFGKLKRALSGKEPKDIRTKSGIFGKEPIYNNPIEIKNKKFS